MSDRIWFYSDWNPENWWERIIYFGGDEYCRRTVVLFSRMVIALWGFEDEDCQEEEIDDGP